MTGNSSQRPQLSRKGWPAAAATLFFLSLAPWSALAAVGRGASGEKDMSLVRTTDQLYKAKVKPYRLRSGTRRCTGEATLSATDFWTGFWTLFWGPIQGWIFHRSAYKPASFQQHIETQAGFVTIEIHLPNLR